MSNEQLAVSTPRRASTQLAEFLGMSPEAMIDTIKAQCFKGDANKITDEQLAAFISIANEMGVNPLLPGMLYAYPSQGAIVPIMGPDGVYKKLSERSDIDSWETIVYPEDVSKPATHATTKIWRKGREVPLSYTALLSEWKVNSNPNWSSRPRHMLGIRSLKQAARMVIHGLPGDEDDRVISEVNVTGTAEEPAKVERKEPPKRSAKGVAAVQENADKPAEAPVDVVTSPVADKPANPVVEAAIAQGIATAKEFIARKELKDGEKLVAICTVESFKTFTANVSGTITPGVKAVVKGEFEGEVNHLGGAKAVGDKFEADPLWNIKRPMKLSLLGRKSVTVVKIIVEKIEEASPASPAAEEI